MYLLSDLLQNDIYKLPNYLRPLTVREVRPKLTFDSNGKTTHYGQTIFTNLNRLVPEVWQQAYRVGPVSLNNSNTNNGNVVWYLDGIDEMVVKHMLPNISSYAIKSIDDGGTLDIDSLSESTSMGEGTDVGDILWIQKPSHQYIGSGKFISIGSDLEQLIKSRPKTYNITPTHSVSIDHWVVQPLLPTKLWNGRKFDCRFFSVVYAHKNNIKYLAFPYGFGRICVNKYDPLNDVSSAITNISVQEKIPGYSPDKHMPLIKDDIDLVDTMMLEMVDKLNFQTDDSKLHVIILGLDILFLPDGTPKLIEVNHEPNLEIYQKNNEMICSLEVIRIVFGEIIPNFIINSKKLLYQRRLPNVSKR